MSSFNTGLNFGNQFQLKPPKRSRRKKQEQQTEELDPGIIKSLGSNVLGIAGAAGNILDLPGSSVRDILAGNNPFDQWIPGNWTSDKHRITGRDLARQYGLAGKEDTWGNFAGGLATELLTDPMTLAGASLFGKTAQGLSKVKAGKDLVKGLGAGIKAGDRALLAGKVPFGPHWAIGTGEAAQNVGKAVDYGVEALRSTVPGRMLATAFHKPSGGMKTRLLQRTAEEVVSPGIEADKRAAKKMQIDTTSRLHKAGITDPRAVRRGLEGLSDEVPADISAPVHEMYRQQLFLDEMLGRDSRGLKDKFIKNYGSRQITNNKPYTSGRGSKILAGKTDRDVGRDVVLKDWTGGTDSVNQFFMDKAMRGMVEAYDAAAASVKDPKQLLKMRKNVRKALEDHITENYAGEFFPSVKVKSSKLSRLPKKFQHLADDPGVERIVGAMQHDLRRVPKEMKAELIAKYGKQFYDHVASTLDDPSVLTPDVSAKLWSRAMKSYKDRVPLLAKRFFHSSKDTWDKGLFGNFPTVDMLENVMARSVARRSIEGVQHAISQLIPDNLKGALNPDGSGTRQALPYGPEDLKEWNKLPIVGERASLHDGTKTVGEILNILGMNPKKVGGVILSKQGMEVTPQSLQALVSHRVPKDIAEDMVRMVEKPTGTTAQNWFRSVAKQYMNVFKAGVLSHPARHFRDRMGGWLNNFFHGIVTPGDSFDAQKIVEGKSIKGLLNVKPVKRWVQSQGMDLNDNTASDAVRYMFAENIPGDVAKHKEMLGSAGNSPKDLDSVLNTVPGYHKTSKWEGVKSFGKSLAGMDGESSWNPKNWRVRGVREAEKTTIPLFTASEKASEYIDRMNRMEAFINMLKRGWEPEAAMKRINDIQVNYDPDTFTKTEQALKELFPFYSYTSRMLKHTAKELATNPGGGLANVVRLQNAARDRSGTTPDHIADTASIPDPFYKSTDGSKQYFTGLGMMHEDALQFLQPSPQNVTSEVLSRLNPIAQKAIELGTGRSLFFKEPGGGRPVEDLDPTIGRILANVTGSKGAIRYPGDWAVEGLNGMLPTSRLTTTVRQVTDPRKSLSAKALSNLTGLKITTVSPQQQERTLRRKLEEVARSLGGRTFEQIYFPKGKEYTGQAKERVEAYKTIINALSKRAKSRSKDKLKK